MSQFRGIHVDMAPLPEVLRAAGLAPMRSVAGWFVVGGKRTPLTYSNDSAHYFAVRKDGALGYSLCGGVGPLFALERWTAHDHAGRVRMCKTCRSRLERRRVPMTCG